MSRRILPIILRVLAAIGGFVLLGYGVYLLGGAINNPSLKMYFVQGGSDTVQILGRNVVMSTRLFVVLIYMFILALVAGGIWLCVFAFRARGKC